MSRERDVWQHLVALDCYCLSVDIVAAQRLQRQCRIIAAQRLQTSMPYRIGLGHAVFHRVRIGLLVRGVIALIAAFAGGLLRTEGSVSRSVFFVAVSGKDSNDGSETRPFRTISRGASVLTAGSTLYVRAGVYSESLYNSIPGGSSWDMPVTVAAYPGEEVILKPGPASLRVLNFEGSDRHHIVVDRLVLDAVNVRYDAVKIGSLTSDLTTAAHHIRLINCEIRNAPQNGILSIGSNNEFTKLNIHHNATTNFGHGIYIASSDNVLEDSEIHHNSGYGVHVYNTRGGAHRNVVRRNTIHNNGRPAKTIAGLILSSGAGHVAYNNIIWANGGIGAQVDYGGKDARLVFNTVYNNAISGVFVGVAASGTVVVNNIVYANRLDLADHGVGTRLLSNVVSVDPLFVDPAAYNFKLLPGSPAIRAGVPIPDVVTDYSGMPRVSGGSTIGALEFRPPK